MKTEEPVRRQVFRIEISGVTHLFIRTAVVEQDYPSVTKAQINALFAILNYLVWMH
jgi:hypothetical protein